MKSKQETQASPKTAPVTGKAGKGFTESLSPCLPADDRPRVAVAEQAGRLDETLGKLAKSHRELHLHRLKQTATAFQLASVVALAPLCFGLIMWILWPTMAVLRDAGGQLTGLGGGAPAAATPNLSAPQASPHSAESAKASRFNEMNAKNILGYMQEHAAAPSKDSSESSGGEAAPAKKKKLAMPKLKPAQSMKGAQFQKIAPSTIKSHLD